MTHHTETKPVLGQGHWQYQPVPDWPQIPKDIGFVEAIGVAIAQDDRVFVFNRGNPAVLIFQPDGQFLNAWGEDVFVRPHGITSAPDQTVYLTDDLGHSVAQYTPEGQFLRNIGPAGNPSQTGVNGFDYRSISSAGPYNLPTNVAVAPDGHLFIADGYGNASVHHFDTDGHLVRTWGARGDTDGRFNVPHGICVDAVGRILVADRENSRIQIFNRAGQLLQTWADVVRPCQVFSGADNTFFVAELGNQNGRFPWQKRPPLPTGGRVSIFDSEGRLLSRWGGGLDARRPNGFYACHDISVDSRGSIYVGEVAVTAAAAAGEDATGLPTLRKFIRV
ncbi:MAG: peptidyl-alpha-hydroxyglycine alpha-amidating lyase family protein [Fuerstiella sp.]|jgi:sugar lactone lactonase YvrE|nr:peptidyl-alpha-hydroxyglycine alpha-amidating lyase family protein [Fuerstiella sp.]